MSGHGWVIPNENGTKARCGGPGLCSKCSIEQSQQLIASTTPSGGNAGSTMIADIPGIPPGPTIRGINEEEMQLLSWIEDEGGGPTAALEMLKGYNLTLGKAWASGYAKGLEDGSL